MPMPVVPIISTGPQGATASRWSQNAPLQMGTRSKPWKEKRTPSSSGVGQALESHRLGLNATPLLPGCAALEKVFTSLSLGLSSARRFEWMGFKL